MKEFQEILTSEVLGSPAEENCQTQETEGRNMTGEFRVLGIDLASRSWQDNGSAILSFTADKWKSVECGCIKWPERQLSAAAMAEVIEGVVRERAVAAVSLDGPQGWREPNAGKRAGVGRVCEYEAQCQGKTGEYGKTYPQTQHGWIKFCIDIFAELVERRNARMAKLAEDRRIGSLEQGQYWLLECFPTSTWRASRLAELPGKSRVGNDRNLVAAYAKSLQQRYGLPQLDPWQGTHDDLQAIVAALPAAGVVGGPCLATPKGKASWSVDAVDTAPSHWVEGIIWDGTLTEEELAKPVELPAELPKERSKKRQSDGKNPLLIDDRDDAGDSLLDRGVRLFRHLARLANTGDAVGVGYAQLAFWVHGVERFQDVTNRSYSQADTTHVLRFAQQITEAGGGPLTLSHNGVSIEAGMDAFVWQKKPPHDRPSRAFEAATYSEQDWRALFPDGSRRLLRKDERCAVVTPQNTNDQNHEDD
ncbi:hypothetical protein OAG76_04660 [Rubripirellula sp.]|nr:hypothetical protein [Rubripirellula sp.]MDB4634679.1 hypothetical protein [Rubripirellula sp.]MDC0288264.1 hypothetical protein [Rubripirellula sp.]